MTKDVPSSGDDLVGDGVDAPGAPDADDFLREVARVDAIPPPSPLPFVGQRIARFRILGELGRGGMGIVYLAHDDQLSRPVALKVLVSSLTRHEERRHRFLREARTAAAVSHPNLATIYDVGEVDGRVFIAMERVEGQTLRRVLASRRLTIDETVDITLQILAGLAKAHQVGVVHRDLKPDNVMLTGDGVVKLLDFGLAKQFRAAGAAAPPHSDGDSIPRHDTAEHQLVGTPGYMSPEQVRGKIVDARSDIFAVGVILYEMLAGRRPFTADSEADLLTAILRDTPEPIARQRDGLPAFLARAVERCLEKDPERRYQDCASITRDLTPAGASALSSSPLRGIEAPAAAMTSSHSLRRRSRGIRWIGAAAAVAALGVAAAFTVRGRDRSSPPPAATPAALSAARPTAVTDLPLPASRSPEAVAEYAAATQGLRDGNWGYVYEHLGRAVTLDPSLAAAHLRLAIVHKMSHHLSEARAAFARALLGRATLSERDQVLLAAYEPALNRDPPNQSEWQERMRAATVRYPGDAELFGLLAYCLSDAPEESLRAAQRSVELDPQYADGWQAMGERLMDLGKTEESLVALDRCLALSPATADCRAERGWVRATQGRCAEMEDDLRHAVASSNSGVWHDGRAAALFALGRPPEAVLEVFRNKWAQLSPDRKTLTELQDRTRLDIAQGNFRRAEEQTQKAIRLIAADSDGSLHTQQAVRLVAIYTETNRPREAAAIADDYLKRKDVWIGSGEFEGAPLTMFWVMLRGGLISKETFEHRRDEWIASQQGSSGWMKGAAPLSTYAMGVRTPEEAREALRLFPQVEPPPTTRHNDASLTVAFGWLYLLSGQPGSALPLLRRAVNDCSALISPFEHTRSAWFLGQALEATGDPAGACAAYADVLRRWGDARPPSMTAAQARDRARALRCPGPR